VLLKSSLCFSRILARKTFDANLFTQPHHIKQKQTYTTTMTMMMMKGVAVLAALGLFATGAVSADDEFACAPDGKMKQVQLSAFSMEGTLTII
jgi:hypothetical protein